ncbi:DUF2252 domain-containing protein [Microbacterium hominis]|uniref:DUF2252 domain-containing protein n=1 Tax=Microbacterium hominis TaxID=162426 RepID=UPI0019651B7B|nr:DUF2252 family protein [Microbacterium hominis]QRY39826.1 DUF2252 domain-containing protein [Microbacterium hominis]
MTTAPWSAPASRQVAYEQGRTLRRELPRRMLAELPTRRRDPLGILSAQNAARIPELVPLRDERMSTSPFAFYRGTAALMADDLAAGPSSGILVASCGDAHVANFGFYASPQRTLVFDLNDFDESAWASWEWDLKRLVASIVVAGQATGRDDAVTADAARAAVVRYARALAVGDTTTPLARFYQHFDAAGGLIGGDKASRKVLRAAIADAENRTGDKAVRKMTALDPDGRLRFVEQPPTMTHVTDEIVAAVDASLAQYIATTRADVQLVLSHYSLSDVVRRVVGVGSVGTRCYVAVFVDGDGAALLMQVKEAGRSVLEEYGGAAQPAELASFVASHGQGGRVVALQRILQGSSDPFLGHFRGASTDYYVRQFRDMKGGIDAETLEDAPFRLYAQACATVLARAHGQSPNAARVVGYLGSGRAAAESIVEWAYGYAALSRADYGAFVDAVGARTV